MKKFVEIFHVAKRFGSSWVVKGFDLDVAEGEVVALIGPSGCGKSTILSMVAGLLENDDGGVVVAGREIDGPGPDRGVVFQSPSLLPWLTAAENVELGIGSRKTALEHLELVGLGGHADKYPDELSLGMRQRVSIARAFALDPRVMLLDEPFGMVDGLTRIELQDALASLVQKKLRTMILVTHDVDEALFLSTRVAMMTRGPEAKLGGVLQVDFPRPRDRVALAADPRYAALREELLSFLEKQAA
jgi:nitrate/nitrite transport system ATP-binding protein